MALVDKRKVNMSYVKDSNVVRYILIAIGVAFALLVVSGAIVSQWGEDPEDAASEATAASTPTSTPTTLQAESLPEGSLDTAEPDGTWGWLSVEDLTDTVEAQQEAAPSDGVHDFQWMLDSGSLHILDRADVLIDFDMNALDALLFDSAKSDVAEAAEVAELTAAKFREDLTSSIRKLDTPMIQGVAVVGSPAQDGLAIAIPVYDDGADDTHDVLLAYFVDTQSMTFVDCERAASDQFDACRFEFDPIPGA